MRRDLEAVARHYGTPGLEGRILAALDAAGKDVGALSVDDLAPVDEFHIRGRTATEELAGWAGVGRSDSVLDVGSGLGGTARFLAATRGCRVQGLDLTPEFCEVAARLSRRVGLDGRTTFRQGSALAMPFPDREFDVVWTEHVQMNIADKAGFYGEIARVTAAGGRFAFHDVLAGDAPGRELAFPVPWAFGPAINHLIRAAELEGLLAGLGFAIARWEDRTEASIRFFRNLLARIRTEGRPPVWVHLLMDDTAAKLANLLANLEAGGLRVLQAVVRRT